MIYPEVIILINSLLSCFSNGLLIYLILKNSPASMANYKYLMLIFAIFGVLFAFVNISSQPILHFHQSGYVIFSKNPLDLPRALGFWYIAFDAACLGMTLSLLSFHFIYRFFTVCKPKLLFLFSFPYFIIPTAIFIAVSMNWWLVCFFGAGESQLKTDYFKKSLLDNYGVEEQEYTYIAILFFKTDPITLEESWSLPDCLVVLNLFAIISLGFSVIFYCWYRIHHQLQNFQFSPKTLEMQTQLFLSLIIQTLIPVFFLYLPAGIIFLIPILKIQPGPLEGVFLSLITTQSFVDALIPMYFIKSYRKAVKDFFEITSGVVGSRRWVSGTVENNSRTVFVNKT